MIGRHGLSALIILIRRVVQRLSRSRIPLRSGRIVGHDLGRRRNRRWRAEDGSGRGRSGRGMNALRQRKGRAIFSDANALASCEVGDGR